jgi:hypothetical protein
VSLTYYVVHAGAAHVVVRAAGSYVVADVVLAEELEERGVWGVDERSGEKLVMVGFF